HGGATAGRDGCGANPGPAVRVHIGAKSIRGRSDGPGRRAPAVRPVQLLRLPRWTGGRRHGSEPPGRRLAVRQQRRTGIQLHRGGSRARHAVVGYAPDGGPGMEARRLHQVPADAKRAPGAAHSIEVMLMARSTATHTATIVLLLLATAGCSRPPSSPAETQGGAAADLNRPPQAGAASAGCSDLPPAEDLQKWLRAAPGVEGEAGGLFSGKREWGTIVNRQGEICATAVATDDPAGAWPGSQAISKAKAYT